MDRNKQAVAIFNKNAQLYQHKYMDVSDSLESLDAFCQLMKQGAAMLEIACGPGNITKYLLQQRPDLQVLATDLAPNMLELAKAENPQADFELMDGRDIGKLSGQFDAIVCSFLLPYLSREEAQQFIADASSRLKTGGVLYLSTMADDYNRSGIEAASSGDEVYVYYHEERQLIQMLENNAFHIRHLRRREYRDRFDIPTTDLVIVAVLS